MSAAESNLFEVPQREHIMGVLSYFTKGIWVFVRGFWPIIAGLALWSDEMWSYASIGSLIFVLFLVVTAGLEYWRFTFYLTEDSLVVDRGVFEREQVVIPFDRIQAVHMHQNAWQQVLGLSGLRVDTAGTAGSELDFKALRRSEALALRARLTRKEEANLTEVTNEPLLELDTRKLLQIGLTQNHLRTVLIAFGALVSLVGPLDQWIEGWFANLPGWTWMVLSAVWVVLIVPVIMAFFLLAILISLVSATVLYYRLKLQIDGSDMVLESGLFKRNEFRIPLQKIQVLEWKSTWLRRQLHLETLQIRQATSGGEGAKGAVSATIPGLLDWQSDRVVEALYPNWNSGRVAELRPMRYLRMRLFILSSWPLFPLGVLMGGGYAFAALSLFWMGWRWYSTRRSCQGLRAITDGHVMVIKKGWIFRSRIMIQLHQLQRVSLHQNAIQAHRGVAHVVLHTAAGSERIGYLEEGEARRLVDYALYRLESHNGAWM